MKPKHSLNRIRKFLEQVDWAFELNNFKKVITEVTEQPKEQPDLTAEVMPDLVYKEITIKIYPNFWELSLDGQRAALLHELVHTLTHESILVAYKLLEGELHTVKEIKDINERTTTSITRLLDCLLQGKLRYFIKAYKDYLK